MSVYVIKPSRRPSRSGNYAPYFDQPTTMGSKSVIFEMSHESSPQALAYKNDREFDLALVAAFPSVLDGFARLSYYLPVF